MRVLLVAIVLFLNSASFAQEESLGSRIRRNLFQVRAEMASYYVQGGYTYTPTLRSFGIQLKRMTSAEPLFLLDQYSDQELRVDISEYRENTFLGIDANAGFQVLPILRVTFGGGINYTQALNHSGRMVSIYPRISISMGGLSLQYSRKTPLINEMPFPTGRHAITIAFGPRVWLKKLKKRPLMERIPL